MTSGQGKRRVLLAICLAGTLLFTALGIWQVQRLGWKRELIARVEARVHAAAVRLPGSRDWGAMDLHDWEYRRVRVDGMFLHDSETLVDAVTELGPGSWVITPLGTADGVVLVNRGFVTPEQRDPAARAPGPQASAVSVTGLLRRPEPGGRVLRPNDPAADRWFSRDVAGIAAARAIRDAAPFFIDADASPGAAEPDGTPPRGGLTVVRFRNAHLAYAATWFTLAALCVAGMVLLRVEPSSRGRGTSPRLP